MKSSWINWWFRVVPIFISWFLIPALGLVVLAITGLVASATALDELCLNKGQNTFVAHPDDCQKYILCQNGRAIEDRCPQPAGSEIWFDPIRQACAPPGNFCSPPPCTGHDRRFVSDPASECGGWIYCLNNEISHSETCPYGLSFVPETQYCTYPVCSSASVPIRAAPHVLL